VKTQSPAMEIPSPMQMLEDAFQRASGGRLPSAEERVSLYDTLRRKTSRMHRVHTVFETPDCCEICAIIRRGNPTDKVDRELTLSYGRTSREWETVHLRRLTIDVTFRLLQKAQRNAIRGRTKAFYQWFCDGKQTTVFGDSGSELGRWSKGVFRISQVGKDGHKAISVPFEHWNELLRVFDLARG
jgi:hypothetical protein